MHRCLVVCCQAEENLEVAYHRGSKDNPDSCWGMGRAVGVAGAEEVGPGAAAWGAAACKVAAGDRGGGLNGCCGMDQLGFWP